MIRLKLNYLLLFLIINKVLCDSLEDNWIDVDAWAREYQNSNNLAKTNDHDDANDNDVCRKCNLDPIPNPTSCSDKDNKDLALMVHRKFLVTLFRKQNFEYDPNMGIYSRRLDFIVTSEQLDRITEYKDPRDLDTVLIDILSKAKPFPKEQMGSMALFGDIFKDFKQLLKTSEIQFALIAIFVLICGWLIHYRYRISYILIAIGGALIFGYFLTYLECNKKLEVERMLEALESNDQKDNWLLAKMKNWFGFVEDENQKFANKLRKSSKLQLPFCRPDQVFILYFNGMFFQQLEVLLEQCIATFGNLKERLGFPYNLIAGLLLVGLVGYVIKLTFKYILSPAAWSSFFHNKHLFHKQHEMLQNSKDTKSGNEINNDRISGENLRLLLTACTQSNIKNSNGLALPETSGVQEVIQQIQYTITTSDSPNNSKNFSNNSSKDSSPENSFELIKSEENKEIKSQSSTPEKKTSVTSPNTA